MVGFEGCGSGVGRLQHINGCAAAVYWSTGAAAAHPLRPANLPAVLSQLMQVKEYCERQFSKILAGRVSVADFVFAKEVWQAAGGVASGGRVDACSVSPPAWSRSPAWSSAQCTAGLPSPATGIDVLPINPRSPGAPGHLLNQDGPQAACRRGGPTRNGGGPTVRRGG